MPVQTIPEGSLRTLLEVSPKFLARLVGATGGYSLQVTLGDSTRVLANARGSIRLFTLENAAHFLKGVGVHRFEIDTSNFAPGRLRKPRPDRAEALRRTRTLPRQPSLL